MNILLTGANGFIGSSLAITLNANPNIQLTAAVRRYTQLHADRIIEVQSLDENTDWSVAVANQEVLIHTAARSHVMKDSIIDSLTEYRRVNVRGTLKLAQQAADAGVKRFIFISSIKVNGERTNLDSLYKAEDIPNPEDPYAISKYEAEQGLLRISSDTGLEVVIIRPPLVYGYGVKGNFFNIMRVVKKGIPLPLGGIYNKRSFIALDNLIDLIISCINHPAAANQIFLASDGEDISTSELIRRLAKAAKVRSRLISVPGSILMFTASLLNQKAIAQRLLESLQVDINKTRDILGWKPPLTVDEGLYRCFEDPKEPISSYD